MSRHNRQLARHVIDLIELPKRETQEAFERYANEVIRLAVSLVVQMITTKVVRDFTGVDKIKDN